ncbi:MAG: PfkB family carbohydrate kinase [Spirochaetaceae bacterium]
MKEATVAVLGDFCVDHYLFVTDGAAERSVETGLDTRRVGDLRVAAGGAGNVVKNLGALEVGTIHAIGVIGDDMYGRELTRLLRVAGAGTDGLISQEKGWHTSVYTKVYEAGHEDPRLDIGARNQLSEIAACNILDCLRRILPRVDVLIVNQQVEEALFTGSFRRELANLLTESEDTTVFVDSRHYADVFPNTIRKINLAEARQFIEADLREPTSRNPDHSTGGISADIEALCRSLSLRWQTPIVVTRGEDGCVVAEGAETHSLPGVAVPRPVDPVGAGDAMVAAMAAACGGGMSLIDAALLGNLSASVTVRKLYRTGTVTPQELRQAAARPAFRMRPDLASHPERARLLRDTRVELVAERLSGDISPSAHSKARKLPFGYAIFDHDGTVSVLREGWEPVMQGVMIRAIIGTLFTPSAGLQPSPAEREEVKRTASALISDTTGIQTIEQMHALRDLVARFGYVPSSEIRTPAEYKEAYLSELHRMIDERLSLLRRGVLEPTDLTIKGAVGMLESLRRRRVTLFLASGSDHDAVAAEARLLGYAELFDGGIFGSVDDTERDPKTVVLERILETIEDSGANEGIVTFGDGPVEIRETKRRGGLAVGVASDEIRRHGLDVAKRRRLILAGADLIVPDFAEHEEIIDAVIGACEYGTLSRSH